MKAQLQRLKDQYPNKKPPELIEFDQDLPQGQVPALGEMEQSVSEPTGTVKKFQEKKQSYKDIQYGAPKRGR
jgi:hypothetical protein